MNDDLARARELAARAPNELTDEALARLCSDPASAPWAVMARIGRGELEAGQTLAFEALEHATRAEWLVAIAAMYEHGAAPLARAVLRELDRRRPAESNDAVLLRELGDVSGEIDKDVVRTLGAFARSRERGRAVLTTMPPRADAVTKSADVLRARAPTLTRLAFPELLAEPANVSPLARAMVRRAILVTVAAIVSAVGGREACTLASPHTPRPMAPLPGVADASSTPEGRRLCAALGRDACARVHAAEAAIDQLDCPVARTEADALVSAVVHDPAERQSTGDDARALRARVSDRCAGITGP